MVHRNAMVFQNALEIIESLPENQQENIIDIIKRRLIEHKRELLAESIKKTKEEYVRGELKIGTVADFMKELPE